MLADLVKRSQPLPDDAKVLILGGGFSGGMLAELLKGLGTPTLCTRRQTNQTHTDLCFNSETGEQPTAEDLAGVTHLLSTIPPAADGLDPVLSKLLPQLQQLPLRWAGYLSTTGVYGDREGAWVAETDPAEPGQARSRRRHACEQAWQRSGLPVQILRLPGIYGPGRSMIQTLQQGRARLIHKPGQVFCRIHVEDIAGVCLHLMHRAERGQHQPAIVNVCDDRPAASSELIRFAANLLACDPPVQEEFEEASLGMSAMARSFWSENRRVSNRLLRNELGYVLLHPDFETGLRDCWQQSDVNPISAQHPDRR